VASDAKRTKSCLAVAPFIEEARIKTVEGLGLGAMRHLHSLQAELRFRVRAGEKELLAGCDGLAVIEQADAATNF
jgi:hypothetical protein